MNTIQQEWEELEKTCPFKTPDERAILRAVFHAGAMSAFNLVFKISVECGDEQGRAILHGLVKECEGFVKSLDEENQKATDAKSTTQ